MNLKTLSSIALCYALLTGVTNSSHAATITFSTDSADVLIGTFSASGYLDVHIGYPTNFLELPTGLTPTPPTLYVGRDFDLDVSVIKTPAFGFPTNPELERTDIDIGTPNTTVSGFYTNGPNALPVDFVINGSDTGGRDGTFSGVFEFRVRRESVPDGGTTAAMLGLALAGIVRFRRSMV